MTTTDRTLKDIASDVARMLDGDWTIIDTDRWAGVSVARQDNPAFRFSIREGRDRDTLSIAGVLISEGGTFGLNHNEYPASIGVSRHRPSKEIAREIQRRLLPIYAEQFERSAKVRAAQQTYEQETAETSQAAEHLIRCHASEDRQGKTTPLVHVWLKTVNGRECTVELSHLTLEKLMALLPRLDSPETHAPHEVVTPIVHLNGDRYETLRNGLREAYEAVRDAEGSLRQCAGNGRNFYPEPGRLERYQQQHARRQQHLQAVRASLEAEVIQMQKENRHA